jgi:hypothetical protein
MALAEELRDVLKQWLSFLTNLEGLELRMGWKRSQFLCLLVKCWSLEVLLVLIFKVVERFVDKGRRILQDVLLIMRRRIDQDHLTHMNYI